MKNGGDKAQRGGQICALCPFKGGGKDFCGYCRQVESECFKRWAYKPWVAAWNSLTACANAFVRAVVAPGATTYGAGCATGKRGFQRQQRGCGVARERGCDSVGLRYGCFRPNGNFGDEDRSPGMLQCRFNGFGRQSRAAPLGGKAGTLPAEGFEFFRAVKASHEVGRSHRHPTGLASGNVDMEGISGTFHRFWRSVPGRRR